MSVWLKIREALKMLLFFCNISWKPLSYYFLLASLNCRNHLHALVLFSLILWLLLFVMSEGNVQLSSSTQSKQSQTLFSLTPEFLKPTPASSHIEHFFIIYLLRLICLKVVWIFYRNGQLLFHLWTFFFSPNFHSSFNNLDFQFTWRYEDCFSFTAFTANVQWRM